MALPLIRDLYNLGLARETASILSATLFGDETNCHAIAAKYAKVQRLQSKATGSLQPAYDHALANTHLALGHFEVARHLISVIAAGDPFLRLLNGEMQIVGRSFADECIKAGELLAPSSLDGRMLQMLAPNSVMSGAGFANSDGLAIAVHEDNGLHSVHVRYIQTGYSDFAIDLGHGMLRIPQPVPEPAQIEGEVHVSQIDDFIADSFRRAEVAEYSVIRLRGELGFAHAGYFFARFLVDSVGRAAEKLDEHALEISKKG